VNLHVNFEIDIPQTFPLFRIFWIFILVISFSTCYILIAKLYERYLHEITITMEQPMPVDLIPFPAVTFLEPFEFAFSSNFDIFYAKFRQYNRLRAFKYLEDTNQVETYLSQVLVCLSINQIYKYPYVGYESKIAEVLRNKSLNDKFEQQEALWNSMYETIFVTRLTSHGFGYTFNILDDDEILNFEE
jgi:hypothetical protein